MSYDHWKITNPADEFLGPEPEDDEEAAWDVRELERETDEWLASWSADFWSDEWLEAATPSTPRL